MPLAALTFKLPNGSAVDHEKGIITGCKLCEVDKVAIFSGPDGKPTQILMKPSVVDKLLALWSAELEGSAHWTHRWIETGEDGLESKVATWKNFRKDDSGNLIADAHLWDTPKRNIILSAAERDPRGIMVSQVFDYVGGRDDCNPISVQAADFVEKGASTTSLLAKLSATLKNKATMADITLSDLKTILDTPEGKAMVQGCIDGHDDAQAEMSDDEMAEMEDAGGVSEDDKKDADKQAPALMKAVADKKKGARLAQATLRIAIATARLSKSNASGLTKENVQKMIEASQVDGIGKTKALLSKANIHTDELAFAGLVRVNMVSCKDMGKAILRASADNPTAYNEWENQGRPRIAIS